jgi:hypothetical protein
MAKFKCQIVRCTGKKGNHKAAANFGDDESNYRRDTRQRSASVRHHERNTLDPQMDNFL